LTFQKVSQRSGIPIHVLTARAALDRRPRCTGSSLALHWIVARAALDRRSRAGPVMAPSSFVEVLSSDSTSSRPRVLEASGVELALPSGLRVSLAIDFDSAALTRLLPLLRC